MSISKSFFPFVLLGNSCIVVSNSCILKVVIMC